MKFILKLVISAIAVMLSSALLSGVEVTSWLSAFIVASFLALFNAVIYPILVFLTIPITIVSFGLFLFVLNAVIILMVDSAVSGFDVNGFWSALLFSLILSFITSVFEGLSGVNKKGKTDNEL
jgi:putative membrane protein